MERATVHVTGVVQSVGFRPFVYRTATELELTGTVRNLGDAGVRIELEGSTEDLDAFLTALREENPPLASVETVEVTRESGRETAFETFEILESTGGDGGGGALPPDTAMCDDCLTDVRNPDSRFFEYWATACVDCGPRFTVIESLPYDRPTTSMSAFPVCEDCRVEYEDPTDRRYHAQTMACPACGPSLRYVATVDAPSGAEASQDTGSTAGGCDAAGGERDPFPDATAGARGVDAIRASAAAIASGEVVVVKGIGGAHLACDATDEAAVARLRKRTGRREKPFALMVPDVSTVEAFASVTATDREHLRSPRRPILLVERTDGGLAENVAPGLHTVGVMLPYAGVHHLLFDALDGPVVLTSANMPGRPMLTANADIVDGLADVADGFLLHDRRIVARCDDSVARVVDGDRRLVRRSRGFTPTPVPVPGGDGVSVLGLGPERNVVAGVLADGDCHLTQYVGDVDDLETFDYLQTALDHLLDVSGVDHPTVVSHDAHPEFRTTDYAHRLVAGDSPVAETVAVQHHHAHAASVLAEHDRESAIAITVDGIGYGPDGTVWGGEVLDATRTDYDRVGGLAPVAMPGGDRATRYPARMVAGFLADGDEAALRDRLAAHVSFPRGEEERDVVCQQLAADVNAPTTTSAGRFLDAVAALLGVCTERTYEGEPAMKLEALAADGDALDVPPETTTVDGRPVLDTPTLFERLVDLVESGERRADVAATAQETLAGGLAALAVEAAERRGRNAVALTGGVAYNAHVAQTVRERVTDADLAFVANEQVPPGDGGIAYGQTVVAAARRGD